MSDHTITSLDIADGMGNCTVCGRVKVEFVPQGHSNVRACPNRDGAKQLNKSADSLNIPAEEVAPASDKESDIQRAIVKTLEHVGCVVWSTSAFRSKGPSGVTPGIPDLLVRWPSMPNGLALGIEVKSPGGALSAAQTQAMADGLIAGVAMSPRDAVKIVADRMDYSVPEEYRLRIYKFLEGLNG